MKGKRTCICMYLYIMYGVIRTTGGLLNEATKDQVSLTELPFGEVYPGGNCLNINTPFCWCMFKEL